MKLIENDSRLCAHDVGELSAATAVAFREALKQAAAPRIKLVEIDLSTTTVLDSSGLGALLSIHKLLSARGGEVKIARPSSQALQVLELTRLHRVFEIV